MNDYGLAECINLKLLKNATWYIRLLNFSTQIWLVRGLKRENCGFVKSRNNEIVVHQLAHPVQTSSISLDNLNSRTV